MTEQAAPPLDHSRGERADLAAWLAVIAGALGAFMAMLDISITNSALPTIQGEIGATASEGTWIGTSYLVAEIVATPLTAWLARMLGLRRFLLIAAALFTGFSVACGLAADLNSMILSRVGQGLAGGTLVPTALTIIATRLPPSQQAIGISAFGAAALLGPLTGPLLGGWITEHFSWRYAFFINIPVGVGLVVLLMLGLPKGKGDWHELRNADWVGIAGMSIGLGCLTVLLEEGHREQWFESPLIWRLALFATIGFVMVGWGQVKAKRPVLRLALLGIPSLAISVAMMLMMGGLMFGTTYVVPQFLAAVPGYNALQAGQVVFMSGITSTIMMLSFPVLSAKIGVKNLVIIGLPFMAASAYASSHLTVDSDGSAFTASQLLLGVGSSITSFALQQISLSSIAMDEADDASALFMAARNLGGSIGLAIIATVQDWRLEVHRWQLHSSIGANGVDVQDYIAQSTASWGGGPEGTQTAYRMLDGRITLEAVVMAFNDVFLMLSCGALIILPIIFFLKPLKPVAGVSAMH